MSYRNQCFVHPGQDSLLTTLNPILLNKLRPPFYFHLHYIYPSSTTAQSLRKQHASTLPIFHLTMGASALKSRPTVHNRGLNDIYKSQQLDRSISTLSKASHAVSDCTSPHDGPRSPVSPLESNGDRWKYPPRAQAHLKKLETLHKASPDDIPIGHFRSRPMSYYDGLQTSPEPDNEAVFAEFQPASAKRRLSRPFEQPHLTNNHEPASRQRQASVPPVDGPLQANMPRAESHLRGQPSKSLKRKAVPAPLTIPKPSHQSGRQHQRSTRQETRPARRSGPRQENQAQTQRPARHQGWNPLAEPACPQRTIRADHQDRRHNRRGSEDVEWQAGLTRSNNRSKHNDPQYEAGRRCFIFLVIMMILVVVIIVVTVKKSMHQN